MRLKINISWFLVCLVMIFLIFSCGEKSPEKRPERLKNEGESGWNHFYSDFIEEDLSQLQDSGILPPPEERVWFRIWTIGSLWDPDAVFFWGSGGENPYWVSFMHKNVVLEQTELDSLEKVVLADHSGLPDFWESPSWETIRDFPDQSQMSNPPEMNDGLFYIFEVSEAGNYRVYGYQLEGFHVPLPEKLQLAVDSVAFRVQWEVLNVSLGGKMVCAE